MKRSSLIIAAALLALVGLSLFAPTPATREVEASQRSNACQGLRRAYEACLVNNPTGAGCGHIREQLSAHQCLGSSSGGSGSY